MIRLLVVLGFAFVLSACASSSPNYSPAARNVDGNLSVHRSWMRYTAPKDPLLYISDDGTNSLLIFSLTSGQLVGTIANLDNPKGECSDHTGSVNVVNAGTSTIIGYPHASLEPESTLSDSGYTPLSCAVNPKSSAIVAVSDTSSPRSGDGDVAVFQNQSPGRYKIPNMTAVDYVAYDKAGDLYADGTTSSGQFELAELAKKTSAFKVLPITGGSVGVPGPMQYDGQYIAIMDAASNVVYLTNKGSIVGQVSLSGAVHLQQMALFSNTLIAPDSGDTSVKFWTYPAGGSPTKTITGNGLSEPFGLTVSAISKQ